ncbi:MAG TPA: hypothetical protein VLA00_05615 [Xanthobacteraceae bacterium]|nr:hypothetical protein [Xanthobacteraceae bacterium]
MAGVTLLGCHMTVPTFLTCAAILVAFNLGSFASAAAPRAEAKTPYPGAAHGAPLGADTSSRLVATSADPADKVLLAASSKPNATSSKPVAVNAGANQYAPLTMLQGHAFAGNYLGYKDPANQPSARIKLGNAILSLAVAEALRGRPNELPDEESTALLVGSFLSQNQLEELLEGVGDAAGLSARELISTGSGGQIVIKLMLERGNEFVRTEIIQRFAQRYMPVIAAAAPKLPLDIVVVQHTYLGDYDLARGGYNVPIQNFSTPFGGSVISIDPQFVPVPQDKARRAAPLIDGDAAVGLFARITGVRLGGVHSQKVAGKNLYRLVGNIDVTAKRAAIYADKTLSMELGTLALRQPNLVEDTVAASAPPRALVSIRQTPPRAAPPTEGVAQPSAAASSSVATPRAAATAGDLPLSPANQFPFRLGDFMVVPIDQATLPVYHFAAWSFGNRNSRVLDTERNRIGNAQEIAVVRALSLIAYSDWVAAHPSDLTPLPLASHLSTLFLSQKELDAIYSGLTDRQFRPLRVPKLAERSIRAGDLAALYRIDPESEMEFRRRFDAAHRATLTSRPLNRKLVLIRQVGLPSYDFQNQAFVFRQEPGEGGALSGKATREELRPLLAGAMWGNVQATYRQPDLPSRLVMPLARAKELSNSARDGGGGPQLFDARFATVNAADIAFEAGTTKISLDLDVERRALYVEASLRTQILSVTPAPPPATGSVAPPPSSDVSARSWDPPASPTPIEAQAGAEPLPEPGPPSQTRPAAPAAAAPQIVPQPAPQTPPPSATAPPQKTKSATASAAPPSEPAPPSRTGSFRPDRSYDVVGLDLRMTAGEAGKIVQEKLGFKRSISLLPPPNNQIVAFSSAQIFIRDDGLEYIALVTQPDRSGDRLIAIGRYVYEGLGVFKKEDFVSALQDKYGQARGGSGPFMYWGGLSGTGAFSGACFVQLGRVGGNIGWLDNATGRQPIWSEFMPQSTPQGFTGPQAMPWLGLNVSDFNRTSEFKRCGPTVSVWLPELAGQIPEYAVWLTDTGAYMDILTNSMKAGGAQKPRL